MRGCARLLRGIGVICLLGFALPGFGQKGAPAVPRYVELKLAGVDLLHAGAEALQKRFGRAETTRLPAGRALRWRDTASSHLLEVVMDEESGAIKLARVAPFMPAAPPAPPASAFRLPALLTGGKIGLGAPPSAVERIYGRPHAVERGRAGRVDYLYRAPMRPDGSLPAYRARYTFVNARLDALAIALGE